MSEKKTVAIVAMGNTFKKPDYDLELWGVNRAYRNNKGVNRIYFLDPLPALQAARCHNDDFTRDVAALDCPVYCQKHYAEIPKSKPYPIDEIVKFFGADYFTSTIAYMAAHAIYEGFERIIFDNILVLLKSVDYQDQKPCLDFWAGVAIGRGIRIETCKGSMIMKPSKRSFGRYGYNENPV